MQILAHTITTCGNVSRADAAAYTPLFYNGTLPPASYRARLRTWGVGYAVLPDGAGVDEAEIVASGHSRLKPVWKDPGWRLYRVADPEPLADPPATVKLAGPAAFTVRVPCRTRCCCAYRGRPGWASRARRVRKARCGLPGAGGGVDPAVRAPARHLQHRRPPRYALTRGTPCQARD